MSRYAVAVTTLGEKQLGTATIRAVPKGSQVRYRCSDFDRFFNLIGASASAGRSEDRRFGAQRARAHVV